MVKLAGFFFTLFSPQNELLNIILLFTHQRIKEMVFANCAKSGLSVGGTCDVFVA